MAQYTASDWATQVLTDLGAPVSQNNVNNILHWMDAEEPGTDWFDRNNPLNASLGTNASDGTGSYSDLTAAAQYTARMIQQGNMSGINAALQANASIDAFSAAVVASPWASSHYGGNPNHIAETEATGADIAAPATAGNYTGQGAMSAADWAALQQAVAEGGGPYLQAMAAQAQAGGGGGTAAAAAGGTAASTAPASSTTIGGVSYSGTAQQTSALSTIEGNLQTYGFTPAQVSELTSWAWGEITNNVDPTQIAIDLQNQPAFQQQFPGFAPANAQLNAEGLPAVSVQQYQQYQTQAQAMAQAAGLPAGFINSGNVGTLIGGNVSTQELSSRINNAMTLAYQSTPEQQQMFNQYFGATYLNATNPFESGVSPVGGPGAPPPVGLTPGQIAAIALDPTVAEPLIAQQITASQIGGASVTSGVGALGVDTATKLAQAGITEAQATSAFQSLAPYSALETPRPGMGGEAAQGVVSPEQLATGALLGSPGAQRQLQTAEEVAKAPFSGGGGFVQNTKGVAGAGSASSTGAGNT
jgi:hypothetical protein